ncbi:DUF7507 domain-containing protein, partial [Cocleimonas flava]
MNFQFLNNYKLFTTIFDNATNYQKSTSRYSKKSIQWFLGFLKISVLFIAFFLGSTSVNALSIALDGTRTVLSGTDCGSAPTTYRFGTTASWQGTPLDIIVTVNSEDNDYVLGATTGGGSCVYASGGILSVNLRDKDAGDDVAFVDTTITIVAQGTTTPVFIDRVTATGFDLDHNGVASPNTSSTDTDDIYLTGPGAAYVSSNTNVTYSTGSFAGGHNVKFKGQGLTNGNCADTPTTPVISCRSAASWTGGTGINSISTINARFQNDNAYGYYDTANNGAYRLLQLSLVDAHAEEILGPNTDYGDAPNIYGAASHNSISLDTILGNGLGADHDSANQPTADALGDDNDGSSGDPYYDDEDAVRRNGVLLDGQHVAASENVSIDVTTFGTGYLSAWMDLNINDNFADPGEKLLSDVFINSTTVENTSLILPVPYTATGGDTYLRFRFSSSTGVSYSGSITGGEVEDYLVVVDPMSPSYNMVKTSNGPITAAGPLTYTFTFNNTGNVALNDLTVTDPDIDTGTLSGCPIATLAVGASVSCTGIRTITQAQVDAGTDISNTATPSAEDPANDPVTEDDTTDNTVVTTITQSSSLAIVKSAATLKTDADSSTDVTLGDTLEYTVTATNDGNVTLNNIVVSDDQLTPNTATCPTLAPAATCVLTGDHVVTVAEADATVVVNTADVVSDEITTPVPSNTVNTAVVPPVRIVNIGDVTVTEGNTGTVSADFPVTLTQPASTDITVTFTVTDSSGTVGDNDYVAPATTTVVIPAGDTTATISVPVNGDATVEPDETFTVTLTNTDNGTIGTAAGTGTITNDDDVVVSIGNVTVVE